MNGTEVCESCGEPRRVAHSYQVCEMSLCRVALLFWVVITSSIWHVLIIKALWEKF